MRATVRPLARLLGALLLTGIGAGCFFGPTFLGWSVSVRWVEPGLFEGLPPAGQYGLFQLDRPGLDRSLPFWNATLDKELGNASYALSVVEWADTPLAQESVRSWGLRLGIRPSAAGGTMAVALTLYEGFPAEELRARFLQFGRHVSGSNETVLEAWADAFLASKTYHGYGDRGSGTDVRNFYEYLVNVNGPYKTQELFEALAKGGDLSRVGRGFQSPEWRFEVEVVRVQTGGSLDGGDLGYTFTPEGASCNWTGQTKPDEGHYRGYLSEMFQALGVEASGYTSASVEYKYLHAD